MSNVMFIVQKGKKPSLRDWRETNGDLAEFSATKLVVLHKTTSSTGRTMLTCIAQDQVKSKVGDQNRKILFVDELSFMQAELKVDILLDEKGKKAKVGNTAYLNPNIPIGKRNGEVYAA